ncbi:hypothetical protein MPL3365_140059 [Mesorhizobium plurifarium]|uniref:Uncharacterized protein n=1 Tax=Mesorhizobium plurifarium TaxID=69974 RepID=A0A090G444_MESPL|nr:hypothetical protein MPL3365_140059 [Mesorhizobium plurifarium]
MGAARLEAVRAAGEMITTKSSRSGRVQAKYASLNHSPVAGSRKYQLPLQCHGNLAACRHPDRPEIGFLTHASAAFLTRFSFGIYHVEAIITEPDWSFSYGALRRGLSVPHPALRRRYADAPSAALLNRSQGHEPAPAPN